MAVLSESFIAQYRDQQPPFGFNGLGELVYRRTYARRKEDGTNETWYETIQRVVEGTFALQRRWCESSGLGWDHKDAQKKAEDMYDRIYNMKFMPPGRGLWAMGSPLTEEKNLCAALNNCAFVSTKGLKHDKEPKSKPFVFLMDATMLGVGVGFDTKGAGAPLKGLCTSAAPVSYLIPDTREGWVESLRQLLDSYFEGGAPIEFDYSAIRPAGEPIKGFGGVSGGPQPLIDLHTSVKEVLDREVAAGKGISVTGIADIMNLIGRCVVSGNVRRAAEIAFGEADDEEYLDLKNYTKNPHRMAYGWTSNNSVYAKLGMDYGPVCARITENGEPGFAWLDNMQKYSRMNGVVDNKDWRAEGGNPCLEQTLEPYELCCLVETFPYRHESLDDFLATLESAFLYAKTVTLGGTHWPESNRVMLRNRRVGCSMSGIAQFISAHGMEALRVWCEAGYDKIQETDIKVSEMFAVPLSIKTTSVKPSGSVSLLAGATPGLHYPHSRYAIRRVRVSADSELLPPLIKAGYDVEDAFESKNTKVVSFPIDFGPGIRSLDEVSMWEQLSLAAFMQRHWADNQVSCTVTFNPKTEANQLTHALSYFQYHLKGVSFLPALDHGAYPQMPYEAIDGEKYEFLRNWVKPIKWGAASNEVRPEKYCDTANCYLDAEKTPDEESPVKTKNPSRTVNSPPSPNGR
eukprot:comp20580_c0_seq1/m.26495 comp20580_c0_seq1/g.26495  ORF comp20580_c0_seq1/g.26495 comp20580_c0_seq1/m.26495 type:complete len:686 (-) comp20580_c0_seq1:533-2590(-)